MGSLKPENDLLEYNQARYRILAEQSGVMITLHRPGDWAYTAVNPAVEKLTGYKAEELLGMPAYEMFHPEDAEAMKHKLIPAIHKHGTRTFRYRSRNKGGHYQWVESTHRSIRDPNTDELTEIIAVTREVQQEVEAAQALQRLADVVQASADLIIYCDPNEHVRFMNQAALSGWGLEGSRIDDGPAITLKQLMDTASYQKLRTIAFQLAKQKGRWQGALRLRSAEFPDRYWQLEQLIAPAQGLTELEGEYYSLVIRDRSDEKQAERILKEREAELAHSARIMTLGEMASGLAHEINQPLATLLNYARGGLRKLDHGDEIGPGKLRQLLEKIERQGQRAAQIISHLRSMVKKAPHQRTAVKLKGSIEQCIEFVGFELDQHKVEIELSGESLLEGLDVEVWADMVQLEQVWINLIRNSIDAYKGQVEEPKKIKIALGVDAEQVRIDFTDLAGGVLAADQDKIFEPYYSTKGAGLGLGLAISRSIIENHSGQIIFSSDGLTGSKFTVLLNRQ